MKIGVYGGTFDPPHVGHISAANAAVKQLGLDRLLVIPAGLPPHKKLSENTPNAEIRLEMTRLAAKDIPVAETLDLEIQRGGESYTADTLDYLQTQTPDDTLYLLMGSDMFFCIEKWRRYEEILQRAVIGAFERADGQNGELEEHSEYLKRNYGARIELIRHTPTAISSSQLRELLLQRLGIEFLTEDLYAYIIKHRLYGARPELDWLRRKVYAMLKPSRIEHVRGCEEEAAKLAERWGADVDTAREAAILHDITKKNELEEQLLLCEKYGIITDNAERKDKKLLHAKTGAAMAREVFGSPDNVCSAIYWHTTGRANMSLLEKIIYLADYIEPTRDFEGLEKLRDRAYTNIDYAMLLGLEMSIMDLHDREIMPHVKTQEAIDWLRQYGEEGKGTRI